MASSSALTHTASPPSKYLERSQNTNISREYILLSKISISSLFYLNETSEVKYKKTMNKQYLEELLSDVKKKKNMCSHI